LFGIIYKDKKEPCYKGQGRITGSYTIYGDCEDPA